MICFIQINNLSVLYSYSFHVNLNSHAYACVCVGHVHGFYQPILNIWCISFFLLCGVVVHCAIEGMFYELPTENEYEHMYAHAHAHTQWHKYKYKCAHIYAARWQVNASKCVIKKSSNQPTN